MAAVSKDTPLEEIPTPEGVAPLFQPFKMGDFQLETRAVYAPLTRCRALGNVHIPEAAQYYAERTNKGQFMISEATVICDSGYGYPNTPGIHTDEQITAWKPVVEAVKGKGGIFFCQLWHTGRASHSTYNNGDLPVSSSAESAAPGEVFNPQTFEAYPYEVPRALEAEEIPPLVEYYRVAARNAIDLGFDGVEIHASNGYLIDQFLQDGINKRTDAYGGTIAKRCKFCLDVVTAVVEEVGANKVGIRIGPYTHFLGAEDSTPIETFTYLVEQLNDFNILYMHFIEPRILGNDDQDPGSATLKPFLDACKTVKLAAGGYINHAGDENLGPGAISSGHADLVVYGRWALANPDFLKRVKLGAPLNRYDRNTFYVPGVAGYTDYPFLEDTEHAGKYYTE